MSIIKRYEKLIELLKEWLNEENDYHLKQWGNMRERSKKIRTAFSPKINITKKTEIDRILEEAESHIPKKTELLPDYPLKGRQAKCVTFPRGEPIQKFTEASNTAHQASDFINSVNKELLVSLLWEAYEANLESLQALVGEDSRIKIAKERVSSCIEEWRLDNELD